MSGETERALRAYLLARAAELRNNASARKASAECMNGATAQELKDAKALAEKMSGRKLPYAGDTVKEARNSARMDNNIAAKLDAEAEQLERWAELLPLFNAGIVGAYAAAAKLFESRLIRGDEAIFTRGEMVAAILALTPADARQASQQIGSEYLIYVPGHFRCTVCGFQLSKQTLSAQTGNIGITENNLVTEPCPNDGTMMVKVTWKEAAENASERLTEVFNERDAARAAIASAEARARQEEAKWWMEFTGLEVAPPEEREEGGEAIAAHIAELEAAARTPDSTKEPE